MAFIPYITAGDPDLSTTAEALKVLDTCGSDIIELGVPYSDPLADGPVIQVLWLCYSFVKFVHPLLLINVSFHPGCGYTILGKRDQFQCNYFNAEGGRTNMQSSAILTVIIRS